MGESGSRSDAGVRLLQAGDLDGAKRLFQEAIDLNPADGRAHGLLGICQARQGDAAGCIQSLQQAARLLPNDAVAHYNLAMALARVQRTDEARRAVQTALALKPEYSQAQALQQQLGPAPTATPASTLDDFALSAAPMGNPPGYSPGGSFPPPPAAAPGLPPVPPPGTPLGGAAGPSGWSPPAPAAGPPAGPPTFAPPPSGPPSWGPPAAPAQVSQQPVQGLQYEARPVYAAQDVAVGLGMRVLRGVGWGIVFGQWWTLWTVISMFIWGLGDIKMGVGLLLLVVVMAVIFAGFGSVAGLIIGIIGAEEGTGAVIGIGTGMVLLALEVLVLHMSPLNIFFYFITGRYVGRSIAGKVNS